MVTIKTIAEKAGVSIATVSYVLNNSGNISYQTSEKVLKAVDELGYKPNKIARNLKSQRSHSIGIIAEDITVFNTPDIIDQINDIAEKKDYYVLLNNLRIYKRTQNDFSDVEHFTAEVNGMVDVLLSNRVEGIIYIGCHAREIKNILKDLNIPVIFVYCYSKAEQTYSIMNDEEQGGYDATRFLIEKGHQQIGILTGIINSIITQERLRGYQKALMENKLMFNPNVIKIGNWTYESGYVNGLELLSSQDRPSAVFVMNDLMALGLMDAAKSLGLRIPHDVSVIGFDNRECSFFYTPRLTTMSLPLSEMGAVAAKTLFNLIDQGSPKHHVIKLKSLLVDRESVLDIKR